MAERTLYACKQIPKVLWEHLAERLNVLSLGTDTLLEAEKVDNKRFYLEGKLSKASFKPV